ncbi:MAG: hypothetical protein VX777_01555 [Chlamydiota bacterium]|nr:hypothetical protein [Chlamydiota bacterium]
MIMTIIAATIAALMIFLTPSQGSALSTNTITVIMLAISSILFLVGAFIRTMTWASLQKVEQNLTPRVIEFFQKDKYLQTSTLVIFAFPIISVFLTYAINDLNFGRPIFWFALWSLLLGIALDTTLQLIDRSTNYLNPFSVVNYISKHTTFSDDKSVFNSIDSLSEISTKAVNQTLPSLSVTSIENLQKICKNYLLNAKAASSNPEIVSYTLFYLYDKLEYLFDKALESHTEPVCDKLITTMGKFAVYTASYDITLACFPIHFLGRFAKKAQKANMDNVSEKGTCTLLEVGKIFVKDIDLQYLDIKELFFSINQHMEEIAKANFQKNKKTNIAILSQPFHDLKDVFKHEKVATHTDTPIIVKDIERIINQFEQLELIMNKIPSVEIPEEEDKS